MRKRWHVLTLLTVATPVLAAAGMVGIAETREGSYTVVRGDNETLVARAQTPVLLNSSDRVATRESEVRIRMSNGSAVVMRRGEVSFPSADVVRVHSGEAAISFPQGSETVVESGDYRFVPSDEGTSASSLVVANSEDETVAARSLRGQFAVNDSADRRVTSIHSPSPASGMLVSTSTYGFIPAGLTASSVAGRPDIFVQPRTAFDTPTTTVASVSPVAPVDESAPEPPPGRQIATPVAPGTPGTAVEEPGDLPIGSGINRSITTYDLTQPVSSFVTEPGERDPRPRR